MIKFRVLASVFTCCPPGKPGFTGGESLLGWNLLNQIARFHEVWALTQRDDRSWIEESIEESDSSNIHFHYVDLPSMMKLLLRLQGGHQIYYYLWQVKAYFVARKLQKEHHFDLFHHITYANDWMASFIGALLPIAYIRGPGGGAQRTPKKFLSEYSLKGRLWESMRTIGQWIFRHDPFFVASQSHASVILVCNPEALDALPKRWRSKAQLFPVNGVSETDLSLSSSDRKKDGTFRILSAGTLLRIKGFRLAIQAFTEFAGKYPGTELTIIGDGPDAGFLSNKVSVSGVAEKVRLTGWMPRGELLEQMASSDVFLFAGLRDGGGEVVIEAMSMGAPVICFDVGGPALHVTDASGIKIPASSPKQAVHAMAAALERLYLERGLRETMGKAARKRVEDVYHWDRAGERLMEIYQGIISNESTI